MKEGLNKSMIKGYEWKPAALASGDQFAKQMTHIWLLSRRVQHWSTSLKMALCCCPMVERRWVKALTPRPSRWVVSHFQHAFQGPKLTLTIFLHMGWIIFAKMNVTKGPAWPDLGGALPPKRDCWCPCYRQWWTSVTINNPHKERLQNIALYSHSLLLIYLQ